MDSHILKPSVVPPSVNLQPSYHPNDNIDKRQNNGKTHLGSQAIFKTLDLIRSQRKNYLLLHSTKMTKQI